MFDLGLTLENPFRPSGFQTRLIQASVRLNSQLLSQETLIVFQTKTVRDARGSGVVIETDRRLLLERWRTNGAVSIHCGD